MKDVCDITERPRLMLSRELHLPAFQAPQVCRVTAFWQRFNLILCLYSYTITSTEAIQNVFLCCVHCQVGTKVSVTVKGGILYHLLLFSHFFLSSLLQTCFVVLCLLLCEFTLKIWRWKRTRAKTRAVAREYWAPWKKYWCGPLLPSTQFIQCEKWAWRPFFYEKKIK